MQFSLEKLESIINSSGVPHIVLARETRNSDDNSEKLWYFWAGTSFEVIKTVKSALRPFSLKKYAFQTEHRIIDEYKADFYTNPRQMSLGVGGMPLQIDYPDINFYSVPKFRVKEKFGEVERSENVLESYTIRIGNSLVGFPESPFKPVKASGVFSRVKNLEEALNLFKELIVPHRSTKH
jgi:hypothetical protein